MANTAVEIKIVGSEALRQLQGLTKRADSAAAAEKRAFRETEAAAKRAAAAKARADKDATRSAAREAGLQAREADKLGRHQESAAKRSADARIREEERVTKAAAREAAKQTRAAERSAAGRDRDRNRSLRGGGGLIGGVVGGVAAGAMTAAGTARGVAGVEDIGTRVRNANATMEQLIITATNAGMTRAETDALRARVQSAAMTSATDPASLVAGLSAGHERFNALRFVAENLDKMAIAAKAADTEFVDFVGMMGSVQTAFGLTKEQAEEAANILIAGAQTGAISLKDFAGPMAPAMGTFSMNTGQKGIEGLRQFVALMQTVGAGQFGAAESETRATQFVASLNRPDIAGDLEKLGG